MRSSSAGSWPPVVGAASPLVYWAGGYRALRADEPASDRLADAADGLSVALLLLDVGVAEMLDAQRNVEPASGRAGRRPRHGRALGSTRPAHHRVRGGGGRARPVQRVGSGHP